MTDAIRSALEAARAQLINLNDAIDDFWNDPTRPSVATMRSGTVSNLSIAQLDARASLAKIDAALASLDAPQPDALREAENAVSHAFGLLSSADRIEQQAAEIRRLTEVAQDWCRDARHNESVADEWKRQYEKEHERAEKFMWQVRDTCARAEQAERERDEAREAAHYANGTAELAMKHRDTAEARVKELEEALDPFAAVAEHDIGEDEVDKDRFTPMVVNHRAPLITVGDLRRARAALKGE